MGAMRGRIWCVAVAGVLILMLTSCVMSPLGLGDQRQGTPRYTIVGQTDTIAFDNRESYYVLIDPVDLSSENFKDGVIAVLEDIARSNGGPDFSAFVFDDRALAEQQFHHFWSYVHDKPLDALSPGEYEQLDEKKRLHSIAMYIGGNNPEGEGSSYEIFWFPDAEPDDPDVGKYTGSQQWKP